MTDDGDLDGHQRSIGEDRDLVTSDPESLDLEVVPDEANGTVTFIAADADAYDTRTTWLTTDASNLVDVTEMR